MSGVASNAAPQAQKQTNLTDVLDCPQVRRSVWLSKVLKLGESDFAYVFFHYLVQEYRNHPNKKRAIFIFDRCLSQETAQAPAVDGQMDLTVNYSQKLSGLNYLRLDSNIDKCKALRAEYVSKGWFGWLSASSDAKAQPPAWLFDGITEYVQKGPRQGELSSNILMGLDRGARINSQETYASSKRKLPGLKRELRHEGFDVGRLGLDDMILS